MRFPELERMAKIATRQHWPDGFICEDAKASLSQQFHLSLHDLIFQESCNAQRFRWWGHMDDPWTMTRAKA